MDIVKKVLPNVNQNQGSFERESVDDHNGAARIKPNDGSMVVAGGGAACPARSPVLRRTLYPGVDRTCSVWRSTQTKDCYHLKKRSNDCLHAKPEG